MIDSAPPCPAHAFGADVSSASRVASWAASQAAKSAKGLGICDCPGIGSSVLQVHVLRQQSQEHSAIGGLHQAHDLRVEAQVLRYIGWIKAHLAEPGETVEGLIVAREGEDRLHYAVSAVPNLTFMAYEVEFHLKPGPVFEEYARP